MYADQPLSDWWWAPGRKPGPPHLVQFDPTKPLSQGLVTILLFDNSAGPGTGVKDYAAPYRVWQTTNGATDSVVTQSPFGGSAYSTLAADTAFLTAPTTIATSSTWTFSTMVQFNGTNPTLAEGVFFGNVSASATPLKATLAPVNVPVDCCTPKSYLVAAPALLVTVILVHVE